MSTDFTVVLAAPFQPLSSIAIAIKKALLEDLRMPAGNMLRAGLQSDTNTFDELMPETEVAWSSDDQKLLATLSSWQGFSVELWGEKAQLYVLVGAVDKPVACVNVWVTLSTGNLERLIRDSALPSYYAVLAQLARALSATAGYGHFELAYEPITPARTEQAILDLPEYPGEPATVGILPLTGRSLKDLERDYGETFDIVRSTASFAILAHRKLKTWLGRG